MLSAECQFETALPNYLLTAKAGIARQFCLSYTPCDDGTEER